MKTQFFKLACVVVFLMSQVPSSAQINKDELALSVSKAEDENLQKLKAYLWKRKSDAFIDGQQKATVWTEFSFDANGKLQAKVVDAETSVKKKGGLRGKMQQNAIEDKMDYVGKSLELSLQYIYMTKGQFLDFIGKATLSKKEDGTLVASADNVYMQGDHLTVHIDPATNLFKYREFKSLLGKDPIDAVVNYEKFSSGVNHQSTMTLNMPSQKMKIEAKNQDYSQRIN
jgi:hypothetical protein